MVEVEQRPRRADETLTLVLPDWQHLDTVLESPLPFALWTVGAQPLLHHWLDHAVDAGFERVRLLVSDRPAEVRQAMREAQLWPLAWEVIPRPRVGPEDARPEPAAFLDHLPGQPPPEAPPEDGWGLLRHWFQLRRAWFADVEGEGMEVFRTLAVGRFCSIHPTAVLRMPVWIEDYAQIGPGCVVGPNVNIGRGALLEGPSHVENSVVTDHTYLAGHTELSDALLDGGRLFNLRRGACVASLDQIVADRLGSHEDRTPWSERVQAAAMLTAFTALDRVLPGRRPERRWETHDGLAMTEQTGGPLWRRRRTWLRHVVAGRMRLVGILPRTRTQMAQLSPDWQSILRRAPAGVLAYSDLHGSHSPDDEVEAVHAVYQASTQGSQLRSAVREKASSLLRIDT